MRSEVIIVGAGPVGLTTAHFLGRAGIRTLLIEKNAHTVDQPRAVSLDDEAFRIFQSLDLMPLLRKDLLLDGIEVGYYNGKGKSLFCIRPTEFPNGFPRIGLFFQPILENTLLKELSKFPHVEIKFNHTVTEVSQTREKVEVVCTQSDRKNVSFSARYLLACDGGKSTIRTLLNIKMIGSTDKERWLVLDAQGESIKRNEISFYCNPARPAVNMPLPHGHCRWEFLMHSNESEENSLRADNIASLLTDYIDPQSIRIIRKAVYTFHSRIASQYLMGRVILLGDAAHLMPPFGGQGLCSGLRDAQNLSWKLAAVIQDKATHELLKTYPIERRSHTKEMMVLSEWLGSVMMQHHGTRARIRDWMFNSMNRIPRIRHHLSEMKIKKGPFYESGFVWNKSRASEFTGKLLPQPWVHWKGKQVLLDELLGSGFSLIGFGVDPIEQLRVNFSDLLAGFQPVGIQISQYSCDNCAQDVTGVFEKQFRKARRSLLLVRPDRFVAADFFPDEGRRLLEFFAYNLQRTSCVV